MKINNLIPPNDKIRSDIAKNGCHIVFQDADHDTPSITYTIGIELTSNRPDVILTGFDKDTAHFLVNEYNSRILDGETFEADHFYEEFLEDFHITFKEVDKKHYARYCPVAQDYYQNDDFLMLHFIWPDTDGTLPWQKKATKEYRFLQPRLYKQ